MIKDLLCDDINKKKKNEWLHILKRSMSAFIEREYMKINVLKLFSKKIESLRKGSKVKIVQKGSTSILPSPQDNV